MALTVYCRLIGLTIACVARAVEIEVKLAVGLWLWHTPSLVQLSVRGLQLLVSATGHVLSSFC